MPDQQTIDRVCVGLAALAVIERDLCREHAALPPLSTSPYTLLCLLLDIPEPIPEWAERALDEHQRTPELLVAALRELADEDAEDICGLCGEPGADKIPHPMHWPGEGVPDSEYVHASCEQDECMRTHAALSDDERQQFLRQI